jgi:glycosyltransferase involved in cell wall biosynthesis
MGASVVARIPNEKSMLHGRQVAVVVPAFQEEDRIARVLVRMPAFVDRVWVVDDGSTDRTTERARAAATERVGLLRHPRRRGVGAAIATGYRAELDSSVSPNCAAACGEDAVAVMAGDGQMDPADLEALVTPIVRGQADYVKGTRFGHPGVRRTMGLPRWIGGQVFSRLTSLAVGRPISDSQCGYTALSRSAAERLDLDGLWHGFGYPNDILGQLAQRRNRIAEIPVRPIYGNEISKLRLRHLPAIFFLIGRAAARRVASREASEARENSEVKTSPSRRPNGRPNETSEEASRAVSCTVRPNAYASSQLARARDQHVDR